MSHSLSRKGKSSKGMAQHSRSVGAHLVGNVSSVELRALQNMLELGVLSQVEITRDGTWFSGRPGPEFRALVKWFLERKFERVDDGQ